MTSRRRTGHRRNRRYRHRHLPTPGRPGPPGRHQLRAARAGDDRAATTCRIFPGDVSDPGSAEGAGARRRGRAGPVEILVNNAGITRDTTFHRMRADQWHDVINTNLTPVFNVTRLVIEHAPPRGWGRVIQISSINALKGQYGQANYAAAKAGMHGFTISLARERRLRHHGQHHLPGYVATDMVMAVRRTCAPKSSPTSPPLKGKPEKSLTACPSWSPTKPPGSPRSNLDINGGHHGLVSRAGGAAACTSGCDGRAAPNANLVAQQIAEKPSLAGLGRLQPLLHCAMHVYCDEVPLLAATRIIKSIRTAVSTTPRSPATSPSRTCAS